MIPRLKIQFRNAAVIWVASLLLSAGTGSFFEENTVIPAVFAQSEPGEANSVENQVDPEAEEGTSRTRMTPFGEIPVAPGRFQESTPEPAVSKQPPGNSGQAKGGKNHQTDGGKPESKKPVETQTSEKQAEIPKGEIVLNFDNADLYEIVRVLADLLQINYIVDPNVRGRVTIHTAGSLKKSDLFPVFYQILEANGLTAVKEGSLYKIIKLKEAPQMPLSTRQGTVEEDVPPGERTIIQIIPLEYISIEEITKLLTPFVTAGGTIIPQKNANTLVIVDKASNIPKLLALVRVFDVNLFEKVNYRFYPLKFVRAEDVAKTVKEFMDAFLGSEKTDYRVIPLERVNSLLLISRNEIVFDQIELFIRQVDIIIEDVEPRIYVYFVRNGQAEELSNLLGSVFTKADKDKKKATGDRKEDTAGEQKRLGEPPPLFPVSGSTEEKQSESMEVVSVEGGGTLKGEAKITPDAIRNALIIQATPSDYRLIESILKQLDVLPRQVLIEVTIAEITLDTKTELGVEWSYSRNDNVGDGTWQLQDLDLSSAGLNLTYFIDKANNFKAVVSALAQEDKVNILSSPSVLASDNKEAKIDVSQEIPVATSEYQYDTTQGVISTNIQYRNTGVILSVTPHINDFGLVSMDVSQEVSEQAEPVAIGNQEIRPSFFKRTVNTTLTVRNGQTIVIGGLIRENVSKGYAGLPCVGNVPVLSYMTGSKSDSIDKTELIIFITPYVITSLDDIDAISEEFRNKLGYDPDAHEYQPYQLKYRNAPK
jgi:general secretion pathway protein D